MIKYLTLIYLIIISVNYVLLAEISDEFENSVIDDKKWRIINHRSCPESG